MESASFSINGPKGQNDDRCLEPVHCDGGWVAAIADGVGGNAGGGRAAEIALEVLQNGIATSCAAAFSSLFRDACSRIGEEARRQPEWAHMATTLSAVRVFGEQAEIAHVGDTRVYHIRGAGIVTRTKDQTEVAELLRQNVLTPSQAKKYPRRNVILSYLGPDAEFDLVSTYFRVISGDTLVLLTDGVYNEIKKLELVNMHSLAGTVDEFIAAVQARLELVGARDDSSMVAIKV